MRAQGGAARGAAEGSAELRLDLLKIEIRARSQAETTSGRIMASVMKLLAVRSAPDSDDPVWTRLDAWVRSVGTTTLPLLAGFSTTSVVVVADGSVHFRWPGITIFLLSAASALLILAVQRAYHACMLLADGSSQGDDEHRAAVWRQVIWTRRFYRIGVLSFIAGLALAVAPVDQVTNTEDWFRWCGTLIAGAVGGFELCWMGRDAWMKRKAN